MTHKNIVVACDSSEQSLHALAYAVKSLCRGEFKLHCVTVLPPLAYVAPVAPLATAGAVTAVTQQWEAQRKADEKEAFHILEVARVRCAAFHLDAENIAMHALPAAGGASGVAHSLVEFVKMLENPITVLGSRGYGAFKRSMMGLVGLGSVGDYCVHNMNTPVVITKHAAKAPETSEDADAVVPTKICVCVDDSASSERAVRFAVEALTTPDSQLHIISVASPVSLPIIDEATAAIAALQAQQWADDKKASLAEAEGCCATAVDTALALGLEKKQLFWKALKPEGGASDVAESIVHYVKDNGIETAVLGSHGYGAWKRSLLTFVGLGSVSDYCVHNLPCAVAIVKGPVEAPKSK